MSPLDAFRIALRAIFANRLRSALTSLGLVIGVSSVIVLIAVGQGTQRGVTDEIRGLGTDLIFIEASAAATTAQGGGLGATGASTLVQSDAEAIAAGGIPGVSAVAAQATIDAQARDEFLAVEQFDSLLEAQVLLEDWRIEYNMKRPHSSLGWLAPAAYAERWEAQLHAGLS